MRSIELVERPIKTFQDPYVYNTTDRSSRKEAIVTCLHSPNRISHIRTRLHAYTTPSRAHQHKSHQLPTSPPSINKHPSRNYRLRIESPLSFLHHSRSLQFPPLPHSVLDPFQHLLQLLCFLRLHHLFTPLLHDFTLGFQRSDHFLQRSVFRNRLAQLCSQRSVRIQRCG